jgi:transposase
MQLVRSRVTHILAIENISARQQGKRLSSALVRDLTDEGINQMRLPPDVALAMQANLAVIKTLSTQIELLEKRLAEKVEARAEYALLKTVPGIGPILASVILLETGSIERFASAGNFASYARCVESRHMSNGKKKGEGNTKNGNKYLSWAFVEAANFALRFCTEAKRFYERKKARTNPVLARKALAHKLARACFHILKERKPFDMTRCFA